MYLLFDIGGTKMRIAVSSDGESFGEPSIIPTPANYEEGLIALTAAAHELLGGSKVIAVAGGIAGPFSEKTSLLVGSPNLPGWVGKPFADDLKAAFQAPVHIENDAAMVGLGEAVYGAGKGFDIVAYITVSTGVNGARIVNGSLDEKSLGFEIGHQIIDPDRTMVPDAKGIYLEDIVSGNGVFARTGKQPKEIIDNIFWDDLAHYLAIGLNNAIDFWSPDIIVLGGSMITGSPAIPLKAVGEYLKEYVTIMPDIPPIQMAALADVGGLWGALAYLKDSIKK